MGLYVGFNDTTWLYTYICNRIKGYHVGFRREHLVRTLSQAENSTEGMDSQVVVAPEFTWPAKTMSYV